jgi:hypothetical protein
MIPDIFSKEVSEKVLPPQQNKNWRINIPALSPE